MEFINLYKDNVDLVIRDPGLEKLIIFPNYTPTDDGILPVGSLAVFNRHNHVAKADYLGSDIGCGILLAKFKNQLPKDPKDLAGLVYSLQNKVVETKNNIGSLDYGRHFIGIYEATYSNTPEFAKGDNLVLVHSGSLKTGQKVFENGFLGEDYINFYKKCEKYASLNRQTLLEIAETESKNKTELIFDKVHNSLETNEKEVIYRKGVVKLQPNELSVIMSAINDEAIVIEAKPQIKELRNSICHSTGKRNPDETVLDTDFDMPEFRKKVCIPQDLTDFVEDAGVEPEQCRTIKEIQHAISRYVEVVGKLSLIGLVF